MRLLPIAGLMLATAATAPALAASPNLVTNGSFEQSSYTHSTEFGPTYGGQGVTGWTSLGTPATTGIGYNEYFLGATATTVSAVNQFNDNRNTLAVSAGAGNPGGAVISPDGGNFVSLDGDANYRGILEQMITGLTAGAVYDLRFDWAATQLQDRTGATTESLQASLGGQTHSTAVVNVASQGFTGWMAQTFQFTATGTSEMLSFLSVGTPTGLPPVALLDGVSLTQDVPEPATLALLGVGMAAGVAAFRRRRG